MSLESLQNDVRQLYDHAKVANEEMGIIQVAMGEVRTDIGWIKATLEKTEQRTWWILGTVILTAVVQIFITLSK
jgi:hypothetical protein